MLFLLLGFPQLGSKAINALLKYPWVILVHCESIFAMVKDGTSLPHVPVNTDATLTLVSETALCKPISVLPLISRGCRACSHVSYHHHYHIIEKKDQWSIMGYTTLKRSVTSSRYVIRFSTKLAIIPKQVNELILDIVSQTSKG